MQAHSSAIHDSMVDGLYQAVNGGVSKHTLPSVFTTGVLWYRVCLGRHGFLRRSLWECAFLSFLAFVLANAKSLAAFARLAAGDNFCAILCMITLFLN